MQDTIPQRLEHKQINSEIRVRPKLGALLLQVFIGLFVLYFFAAWVVDSWHYQDGFELIFASIASLGIILFCALQARQIEKLLRKGYALKIDHEGLHCINLPVIPWADLASATIEKHESSDQKILYLCLGVTGHTQKLIAGNVGWQSAAWFNMKKHESGRGIMIACSILNDDPHRLAWRINQSIRQRSER
jgi:hypothetical protein